MHGPDPSPNPNPNPNPNQLGGDGGSAMHEDRVRLGARLPAVTHLVRVRVRARARARARAAVRVSAVTHLSPRQP